MELQTDDTPAPLERLVFEALHRPFRVERVAVEVKSSSFTLFRLVLESCRGGIRIRTIEHVRFVVFVLLLFRPVFRRFMGRLGVLNGIR